MRIKELLQELEEAHQADIEAGRICEKPQKWFESIPGITWTEKSAFGTTMKFRACKVQKVLGVSQKARFELSVIDDYIAGFYEYDVSDNGEQRRYEKYRLDFVRENWALLLLEAVLPQLCDKDYLPSYLEKQAEEAKQEEAEKKKATKKVAEKKEVAKVEKKATKATAKTEAQENATTVEELTDCNIALECYEVGNIMQPPTVAPGGSLRWYKAKKAKKSEPAPAPVKSEFDFATVATLDSLELFARRERDFTTAAAICRKYGATMEIKGLWLWMQITGINLIKWRCEMVAADVMVHWACEKKEFCWHEPEDGSGFGKSEQTAEQITKKYGCLKIA